MRITNTIKKNDDIVVGNISWIKTIASSSNTEQGEHSDLAYLSNSDCRIIEPINKRQQSHSVKLISDSSTTRLYTSTNGYILDNNSTNVLMNEDEVDKFLKNSSKQFEILLRLNDVESGISSEAEIYVKKMLKTNRILTLQMINEVYANNFNKDNIKIGILHLCSHLDYSVGGSTLPMIALVALSDKNDDVKDYGVQCFENWNNKETLKYLKNIHSDTIWLQEYINNVIKTLEDNI